MEHRRLLPPCQAAAGFVASGAPPEGASTTVVRSSGPCSGRSTFELKGTHADGGLQIEYDVDSPRVGRRSRVRLIHNGELAWRGIRSTTAPSGSFTVRRRLPDTSGTDVIRARAQTIANGELCRGRLSL